MFINLLVVIITCMLLTLVIEDDSFEPTAKTDNGSLDAVIKERGSDPSRLPSSGSDSGLGEIFWLFLLATDGRLDTFIVSPRGCEVVLVEVQCCFEASKA